MANRDDVQRELAKCINCGSVYAARRWPSGKIVPIGSTSCQCGSSDFRLVNDVGDSSEPESDSSADRSSVE
ncbi:hypothetical protein B1756_08455 [Natrarchaeobaculum aegyptiacum]|uniref:Uncharacterized protein n=1 Tax=Natrarchaeobaculum aegyptiacum TaxID=745377 RepID=A0A2Z2HWW7_9EURY|nr:hypothetical protein [Natrarchaeobaculum aegyptiacum]ARS91750.1 hypothetical protein B1756_08455 [Natrarchaeobaculum aegyptiacum]